MMWTPYQINIVLHYHCSSAPWPLPNAPIFKNTMNDLVAIGILEVVNADLNQYQATDRGRALIDMWCATPLPKQKWFDPRFSPGTTQDRT
jgi:hypothetical protein